MLTVGCSNSQVETTTEEVEEKTAAAAEEPAEEPAEEEEEEEEEEPVDPKEQLEEGGFSDADAAAAAPSHDAIVAVAAEKGDILQAALPLRAMAGTCSAKPMPGVLSDDITVVPWMPCPDPG